MNKGERKRIVERAKKKAIKIIREEPNMPLEKKRAIALMIATEELEKYNKRKDKSKKRKSEGER